MDIGIIHIILLIIIVAGLLIYVVVDLSKAAKHYESLPVKTTRAKVKSNTVSVWSASRVSFSVIFKTDEGDMKFAFDELKYYKLNVGELKKDDVGILSYKGTQYLGFEKEEE
jgi:hypothetical protein